eukprot:gene18014-19815_t
MDETIERIFQGRQETLEELVEKFIFLPAERNRRIHSEENFHSGHINGHHSSPEYINGHVETANVTICDVTLEDELPTQEIGEGTALPSTISRVLDDNNGITPKIGNYVDSDVSDLSSLDEDTDIETDHESLEEECSNQKTEWEGAAKLLENSTSCQTETNGLEILGKSDDECWKDVLGNLPLHHDANLQESSNDEFDVVFLNKINDTDDLPGQIFDDKKENKVGSIDVKVTNLQIHTRVKSEETSENSKAMDGAQPDEIDMDTVTQFELDENFDYDNIELTPKNPNIDFDTFDLWFSNLQVMTSCETAGPYTPVPALSIHVPRETRVRQLARIENKLENAHATCCLSTLINSQPTSRGSLSNIGCRFSPD